MEEASPPSDQSQFPTKGGLLGLLDKTGPTIQPGDDSSISPKDNKELLGLLDETNPTFQQQPLPETTTPQRTIPNDLLSNLNDNNLLTNVPKGDSESLNLLEENEQQESPLTETDRDNENIVKDEDKEDIEEEKQQEQQPSSSEEQTEEQEELSANQENEIESEEDKKQESNEEQEQEEEPPITETFNPNTEFIE